MDTDTQSDTAWAVLLSCGHVFHMHCVRSCLEVKPECPTCRASCRPDQAQRVFINNTVSTEDADPSSSQAGKGPGAGEPQFGKESKREPQLECSLYPPIGPISDPPFASSSTPPTPSQPQNSLPSSSHYATGGQGPSNTNVNVSSAGMHQRHQPQGSPQDYEYRAYQYNGQPRQPQQPGTHPQYATLAYDPHYPNQPQIVYVKRKRHVDGEDLAWGACLGATLAACLCCSIQ